MGKYQPRKAETSTSQNSEKNENMAIRGAGEAETGEANVHATMDALQASIGAIRANIEAGHSDMKKELGGFCQTIKRDMK